VVSEGERGLLGVGYTPARVIAVAPAEELPEPPESAAESAGPPPPQEPEPPREDESEQAALVRGLVERVAAAAGVSCTTRTTEDDETVTVTCSGPDLGMLIGRHGQTIDAIQYLANAIVWRRYPDARREVVVDAAGYRERRRATLEALAVRSAHRALDESRPIELEPMTAIERKVVHLRLKEFDGVETTSEGTEPNRYVVVRPT
jgi:spoIIIJ-associated protein